MAGCVKLILSDHKGCVMSELKDKPSSATTVEQTSKQLKLNQAIAVVAMIVGGIVVASADGDGKNVGVLLFVIGLAWYVITRIRVWWHHD